jgi:hypothetical protein
MSLFVIGALVAALPAAANHGWDRPLPEPEPRWIDSGALPNGAVHSRTVRSEMIHEESAGWMRLYFGATELDQGSFLRITSLADGETQELDAAELARWSNTSAYFNGDTLLVELVAGPHTQANRLILERVAFEAAVPTAGCDPGCCGPTDDRVPSDEDWASRLLPAGCSASIYNEDSCAVSAGHCASGGMVLEFKVPLSNPNCSLNHPPVADQFPVSQFQFSNGGVGNDWLAMIVGNNNLGETPFERYGALKPIASTPPLVDQAVTVWGYGVDDLCTANQIQQTSGGFIEEVGSTSLRYSVDVTFGNSGSSVVRDGQEIVGIVTHCCCPNQGTRIDHPSFVAAREDLCPTAPAQAASITGLSVITGAPMGGGVSDIATSDNDYFVVDSVTQGARNNTNVVVTLQSAFANVSELNATVEVGMSDANPVFLGIALFNFDTSTFDTLQFAVVSTLQDETFDFDGVANPNAYVSATGQIQLRITETARLPQTPSGFTLLIDHVAASTKP